MADSRPLGASHVAAVVVGAIIGVGIFFTPAALARALPSPGWILGMWLLGGVVSASGALVFADLGARFPKSGGVYVFLRDGLGPTLGRPLAFLYGWSSLLVIQPGSMAVIALVLVDHAAVLTGPLSPAFRSGAAVMVLLAFTAANLVGLRTGGRVQLAVAGFKIAALAALILVGLGWGSIGTVTGAPAEPVAGTPVSWLVAGLIPVLWSFGGAYHGTYIAGSVHDPERAVPRGILAGISAVVVLYLLVNVAYLGVLGHDRLAATESPAADAAAVALGPIAGKVLAAVIMISAAGILNTVCLGFPFVIYAMARDGVFFPQAGKLDVRTGRPVVAVALQGLVAATAIFVGQARIDLLLVGIAFADTLFQGLVAVVMLRARRKDDGRVRFRAPLAAAVVFLVLEIALAIGCIVARPRESIWGVGALVVGIAAWILWKRRGSGTEAAA